MNSAISSFRGAVSRSVLRVSAIVLVAGLISGPATARADDIVLRWNEIAAWTATATSPFNQSRVAAIVQLAVFEAVNAITVSQDGSARCGAGSVAVDRFEASPTSPNDDVERALLRPAIADSRACRCVAPD
ncbi:MAG TPA: hypothetical protein VEL79_06745 [Vicinamibacterales bacterium]|nr:hypothetical protein [Vicinamibacterales bacterium]